MDITRASTAHKIKTAKTTTARKTATKAVIIKQKYL